MSPSIDFWTGPVTWVFDSRKRGLEFEGDACALTFGGEAEFAVQPQRAATTERHTSEEAWVTRMSAGIPTPPAEPLLGGSGNPQRPRRWSKSPLRMCAISTRSTA
jgi:hypothetical protein